MTTLAQGAATLRIGVAFVMIHVSDGQYNLAPRLRVGLPIRGSAFWMLRGSFATVPGAFDQ